MDRSFIDDEGHIFYCNIDINTYSEINAKIDITDDELFDLQKIITSIENRTGKLYELKINQLGKSGKDKIIHSYKNKPFKVIIIEEDIKKYNYKFSSELLSNILKLNGNYINYNDFTNKLKNIIDTNIFYSCYVDIDYTGMNVSWDVGATICLSYYLGKIEFI